MNIHSIQIGKAKDVFYMGQDIRTGIYKKQTDGPVRVTKLKLEGDEQADLRVHGGVDKAVYAYPLEHYEWWKTEKPEKEFGPGMFGENLTVTGMEESRVYIGDVYRINDVELMVTSPRMPCNKLAMKMGDPMFIKDFMQANRSGFYFRVLQEGVINPGDAIEKLSEDGHKLSISEVVSLYGIEKGNKDLMQKAIASPSLPEDWKAYFRDRL